MGELIRQRLRLLLLGLVWSTMTTVLVNSLLSPKSAKSSDSLVPPLAAKVPLAKWKFEAAPTIATDSNTQKTEGLPSLGRRYQYQQKSRTLSIDMRLMMGDGDVSRFVSIYSSIQSGSTKIPDGQRYLPSVGYYSVLTHEGTAYLTACINPVGDSTVTEPQFRQSRFKNFQSMQIIGWFLGQSPLVDDRCLWTLMSLQLPEKTANSSSRMAESTYRELETIWVDWYHWWKVNFPPY